jgi:hypothetical protein
MFRRRAQAPAGRVPLGDDVRAVIVDDAPPGPTRDDAARAALRRITAEAVLLQDRAEELLSAISARQSLAELAPRGGEMASRFLALRRELPDSSDPEVQRHVRVLQKVFDHHAMMVATSLDMLAVDWRSDAIVEQLESIGDLGAPAQWLEAVRAELNSG